jgi:hypothetical protein
MAPLTVDDLLPLDVYAPRRREFFDSHRRYIDRFRRVRIGPRLTLIFENRQTLWFRVQEVVRIARLSERRDVEQELDLYNRLLPDGRLLQAALLLDASESDPSPYKPTNWRHLDGEALRLVLGDEELPAHLVTCRPEGPGATTAHWVQFAFDDHHRSLLGNISLPATFRFEHGDYRHESQPLDEGLRQSLLADLE